MTGCCRSCPGDQSREVVRTFPWTPAGSASERGAAWRPNGHVYSHHDYTGRNTLPWGTQPEADQLPNAHMGPQLPTDPNDIDIVELIADLTAVVVSADAGEMGRQPALLAALQRAVTTCNRSRERPFGASVRGGRMTQLNSRMPRGTYPPRGIRMGYRTYSNSPSFAPPMKASHSAGVNCRTGPLRSFESRTWIACS